MDIVTTVTARDPKSGKRVILGHYEYPTDIALQMAKWDEKTIPSNDAWTEFEATERQLVRTSGLDKFGEWYHAVESDGEDGARTHRLYIQDARGNWVSLTSCGGEVEITAVESETVVFDESQLLEDISQFITRADDYEFESRLAAERPDQEKGESK